MGEAAAQLAPPRLGTVAGQVARQRGHDEFLDRRAGLALLAGASGQDDPALGEHQLEVDGGHRLTTGPVGRS
jgi:hypothetical protein